jgi:hypothetical protein
VAGAVVEVQPIPQRQLRDDRIEVAVAVDVRQRDVAHARGHRRHA